MTTEGLPTSRLWHPRLRINRVLCVMLHTRWREAWSRRNWGKCSRFDAAEVTATDMSEWDQVTGPHPAASDACCGLSRSG